MTNEERAIIQNSLYFLGRAYRTAQENVLMEQCQRWLESKLTEAKPETPGEPPNG